ncbi:NHLP family bacteriocin export ABC transporter peptidase/permease/ATPase subunit [Butyrivibrio sp.]|uniref:NHLP family bacteriocin export ABC transporter peptidase/permease/ATPase subunit n=1 Tax=Butyrivibrio sp. TaxID=28121 RepID=UPI0025B7F690|nr:NHLP family bacteriocin export ABC transporter peptidase/permease/ATPase subunit [Butyrivibrio sp.]
MKLKKKKLGYAKTPTVYQMEATECGAASLSMIFGYFGKFIPLEQMRIETGVSRDGCNMKNIMRAGKKFGLEVHGYRKDLKDLFELPVPCIIHWNFNHFVVWEGRKGKYCYINDPAMGRRKLTVQDIDDCFTGVVLTFALTDAFTKSKKQSNMLDFISRRLKGQKGAIAALIVLGLFLVVPGIVTPVFSQIFIDDILLGGKDDWVSVLLVVMLGTALFKSFLTWYRGKLLAKLQNKMISISAYNFLSHLIRLPISFYDQRYAGDLSQRIVNNNNISTFLTSDLAQTVLNIFVAMFYFVLMIFYSPILTAIGFTCVIINLLVMRWGASYMGDISMKSQQDQGRMMGALFAGLSITSTLKASGTENEYVSRLEGNYAKAILMEQSMGMRQELLNAIPEVSKNLQSVLTLIVGGVLVIRGYMTAGMLIAYSGLLDSFTEPINSLAGFIQKIQTTRADMARVNDIMKYKEDDKYNEEEYEPYSEKLIGKVELQNVSFGYDILKDPLIDDFSFVLKPGKSIAFVGASGSGKSTVSKLCSGLYKPWGGEIKFDDCLVKKIPPEVLSASVSTVSQSITLFSGTVRDNLTLWNKYISDEDVIRAAKDACIHDIITSKPGAYDYQLSEGGSNFSGGQRQRLEIARALVTNPSVLIMDEATSALDPIVEKQILDNIKRRGCTCIIVAHRLSAIRDCDEIIVMEKGKIVQRGSHEELAALEGHYQRLIQNI